MSWIARESGELPDGFEEATRRAFVAPPSVETERRHLVAIAAAVEETKRAPVPGPAWRVSRPRMLARLAATGAAAALALPVALAGLAFAGVSLPDAADSAFESLGIELPNQSADVDDGSEQAAEDDQRSGAQGKAGRSGSGDGGITNKGASAKANGEGKGKSEADPNGPPEHANGPPEHAADGSTGAPPHSQQGGGGPPDHAADGSTGPPPQAQGNATGQSTAPEQSDVPAPTTPGSSDGAPASGNPHGAPPTAGPKAPKLDLDLAETGSNPFSPETA